MPANCTKRLGNDPNLGLNPLVGGLEAHLEYPTGISDANYLSDKKEMEGWMSGTL